MKAALLRIHAAVFIWGFTGVLGRAISLNEAWLVAWRMIFCVAVLWPFLLITKQLQQIPGRQKAIIFSIGALLALHWLSFYGSIKYANVSIALTCLATSGLLSALLEPLFFRKKHNLADLGFGALAFAGIALIYYEQLDLSTGIWLGLASSLGTVMVSILNKKYITHLPPATITAWQLTGALAMSLLLLPIYEWQFPAEHWLPQGFDWMWLLILSLICTLFTFFLYIKALHQLSAFTVSFILTLEPVYGIVLAFFFYQENELLGLGFYAGFGLILLGVVLHTMQMRRQRKAKEMSEAG